MGQIRDNFGRIAVESRSESFYVHAAYGYSPKRVQINTLGLGDTFIAQREGTAEMRRWRVSLIAEDRVEGREEVSSVIESFLPGTVVVDPDGESFDADEPLAKLWNNHPHPEFAVEDLDDLIAALVDYRESRS